MFALTYLLRGRRQALVGLPVIACTLVQDTSKAAGRHNLPHIQNWTPSFEKKSHDTIVSDCLRPAEEVDVTAGWNSEAILTDEPE